MNNTDDLTIDKEESTEETAADYAKKAKDEYEKLLAIVQKANVEKQCLEAAIKIIDDNRTKFEEECEARASYFDELKTEVAEYKTETDEVSQGFKDSILKSINDNRTKFEEECEARASYFDELKTEVAEYKTETDEVSQGFKDSILKSINDNRTKFEEECEARASYFDELKTEVAEYKTETDEVIQGFKDSILKSINDNRTKFEEERKARASYFDELKTEVAEYKTETDEVIQGFKDSMKSIKSLKEEAESLTEAAKEALVLGTAAGLATGCSQRIVELKEKKEENKKELENKIRSISLHIFGIVAVILTLGTWRYQSLDIPPVTSIQTAFTWLFAMSPAIVPGSIYFFLIFHLILKPNSQDRMRLRKKESEIDRDLTALYDERKATISLPLSAKAIEDRCGKEEANKYYYKVIAELNNPEWHHSNTKAKREYYDNKRKEAWERKLIERAMDVKILVKILDILNKHLKAPKSFIDNMIDRVVNYVKKIKKAEAEPQKESNENNN